MQEAVLVEETDIPGVHPAIRREGLRRQSRGVEISGNGCRAPDDDFTGLSMRNILAMLVDEPDFNIERRTPAGAEQFSMMILGSQDRQAKRRFGLSIVLPEPVLSEPGDRPVDDGARHR